jgi:hypothetical protein
MLLRFALAAAIVVVPGRLSFVGSLVAGLACR